MKLFEVALVEPRAPRSRSSWVHAFVVMAQDKGEALGKLKTDSTYGLHCTEDMEVYVTELTSDVYKVRTSK